MCSYTGWCGSADYLIDHISQSSQSFGWHDNARSYNSAHGWWLLPCHQIADVIPGMSERECCNRTGNFDVEWAGRKRLWNIVRVNYRRMGLRFRLVWHDRISCFRSGFVTRTKYPIGPKERTAKPWRSRHDIVGPGLGRSRPLKTGMVTALALLHLPLMRALHIPQCRKGHWQPPSRGYSRFHAHDVHSLGTGTIVWGLGPHA